MHRWFLLIFVCLGLLPMASVGLADSTPFAQPEASNSHANSLENLQAAVAGARTALTAKLNLNDDYKNAQQQLADAQTQLDLLPPDADRNEAAQNKQLAATQLDKILSDLTQNDPNISKAQQALDDATHALTAALKARRGSVLQVAAVQIDLMHANFESDAIQEQRNNIARADADAEEKEAPELRATGEECFESIGPPLQKANGVLTPAVRSAYLDWAEKQIMRQLGDASQTISADCLTEVHSSSTLRDAIFGSVYPPDPSILQNYAYVRAKLGGGYLEQYRSLALAISVAKRIKGVETDYDPPGNGEAPNADWDFGRDYQPGFWTDETLRKLKTEDNQNFARALGDFMKANEVSALDLYQSAGQRRRLVAFLQEHHFDDRWISKVKQSVDFGQWLKNAMVILSQRPAAREKKPDSITWMRFLISQHQTTPTSTPTVDGKVMRWPLFPIDKAPWPLLMPLAHPVPLSEAMYIWQKFQGEFGDDRWHTYGPYRGEADAMPYMLQPSRWFWDAWPDRIVWGGECVPISKGTVDLYSAMGKPAMWAGQPGHANLISFQFVGGAWTAQIEQAFAGGPDVTFAQWYFDEDRGTELRYRNLYYWPGAEYHLGVALAMNFSLQSYMDTRLAANIFRALPAEDKQTIGVQLLSHVLEANPFNPEIWYRLGDQMPGGLEGLKLTQLVMSHTQGLSAENIEAARSEPVAEAMIEYWQTVEEFEAGYVLKRPLPQSEPDLRKVYELLARVPGMRMDQLANYLSACVETGPHEHPDAVQYDKDLADYGNQFGELRMGQRYRDGDGVPKDDAKAEQYFFQAAAQGDLVASLTLEQLLTFVSADLITVNASSVWSDDQNPIHLVDGSGMTGMLHDNAYDAVTMWHTAGNANLSSPAPGLPQSPAWVKFDFARPVTFNAMLIWNHNQKQLTDRGFCRTRIYGSSDGNSWFPLTSPAVIQLPRSSGTALSAPVIITNAAADRPIKSVIIAATPTMGNYGGNVYGLSAVRFVSPVN
jgi:hypothetical protein